MATILCDGCGQEATAEHIARRLKRLENMTRYRPIHVQTLFLGAASPADDCDDLYSAEGEFRGEGAEILRALGIETAGRSVEEVLAGMQRQGLLVTHLIDCAVIDVEARLATMQKRLPSVLTRIRRSYKPKRVVLVGAELSASVTEITSANLGAELILDAGRPFEWSNLSVRVLGKEAAVPFSAM